MKTLVSFLTLLTTLNLFAVSIEEAKDLYGQRGSSIENAKKAALMFGEVAQSESDIFKKADLLTLASQAWYYYAFAQTSKDLKKEYFQKGIDVAESGVKLVQAQASSKEQKLVLAKAMYQYGANLGKWGEANGVIKSLIQWPKLRKSMEAVINLGFKSVENYGPNRILGRAYFKLPKSYGGKAKSLELLKEAYENTKNGQDISTYGLNTLYYVDTLLAVGQKDLAISILKSFIDKDPVTFNPSRVPETTREIQVARKKLDDL
jgi:tetratricopeptide (TPR) repeat protein